MRWDVRRHRTDVGIWPEAEKAHVGYLMDSAREGYIPLAPMTLDS